MHLFIARAPTYCVCIIKIWSGDGYRLHILTTGIIGKLAGLGVLSASRGGGGGGGGGYGTT